MLCTFSILLIAACVHQYCCFLCFFNKDFTSRTTYWILINVNKSSPSTHSCLEHGQWHRQSSGMQGQMISLVVNVAFMHHWAKPSQTAFRRSAIWRWPLTYSGGLCCIRREVYYPTAMLLRIKLNETSMGIIPVMLKAAYTMLMLTNHWGPPAKALSPPPLSFPYLCLPHGT